MSAPPEGPPSTGQLVAQMSQDISRLMRDELRLAQLEVSGKAKQAGIGAGMFGAAGVIGLLGGGALVATAILALAHVLDAWLAALVVAVVLLLVAGVTGLVAKRRIARAAPPAPTRAMANLKEDVDAVRHPGSHH